jgi:hypothetical protein
VGTPNFNIEVAVVTCQELTGVMAYLIVKVKKSVGPKYERSNDGKGQRPLEEYPARVYQLAKNGVQSGKIKSIGWTSRLGMA